MKINIIGKDSSFQYRLRRLISLKRTTLTQPGFFFFFLSGFFFHEHSQFRGQQGKGEGIYLTPLYHFQESQQLGNLDIT